MKLARLVLLSALAIVALAGCGPEEPTITAPPAEVIERANQALSPSLLTLARNPSAFEGQDLLLAGAYRPLPVLVCAEETHQSPATWALSDGDIEILASGFDGALRELATPGLPLEVEGRWQRWEGPVGCGRRAPSQLVWHLRLTNILSPNPLSASIPITPEPIGAVATTTAAAATADVATTPGLVAEATTTGQQPQVSERTLTPGLQGTPTLVAFATAEATLSSDGSVTVTSTPAADRTGTPSATPNGTVTVGANTPTPTATTIASGSSPTPTPEDSGPVSLTYDDLRKRNIASAGVQEWQFPGAVDLPIAIQVAPSSELDVALELLDPAGQPVGVYDLVGVGQTETIDESDLPSAGLYTLNVSSVDQSSGSYAIVLQSESSRPIVFFQGILDYGETRAGTTPMDGDHLWNFEGAAGDVINVRVRATTPTDMQIYFNNHDGQETKFVNDNTIYSPPQDREEILGYQLPASGLYTVGIGEEDLDALGYTIVIERAS